MALRVVLGEDSYLAREGIERALAGIEGADLVGAFGDLEELRRGGDESVRRRAHGHSHASDEH